MEHDIRLYCTEQGSGEPLILLHGNGEDHNYFQNQMGFFSGKFRVIAVDTRGHGKTPRGTKPFTLETFADDLNIFLEEKGIDRANLLGFSDGGNIALTFALKYPHKVKRMILNGANLDPKGLKRRIYFPIAIRYMLLLPVSLVSKRAKKERELLALMVKQPHISIEDLRTLPMETLVIVGDRDMIRPKHSEMLAAGLPHGQFCVIPGDHFVAAKNSALFNEKAAAFLSD